MAYGGSSSSSGTGGGAGDASKQYWSCVLYLEAPDLDALEGQLGEDEVYTEDTLPVFGTYEGAMQTIPKPATASLSYAGPLVSEVRLDTVYDDAASRYFHEYEFMLISYSIDATTGTATTNIHDDPRGVKPGQWHRWSLDDHKREPLVLYRFDSNPLLRCKPGDSIGVMWRPVPPHPSLENVGCKTLCPTARLTVCYATDTKHVSETKRTWGTAMFTPTTAMSAAIAEFKIPRGGEDTGGRMKAIASRPEGSPAPASKPKSKPKPKSIVRDESKRPSRSTGGGGAGTRYLTRSANSF